MIKAQNNKPKAQTVGAYPGFLSYEACLGVLLLPPRWDATAVVHHRVTPQQ